jgi:hypothetical protein
MNEAEQLLKDLVEAWDDAFISSWQSTGAWQKQLAAAIAYLKNKPTGIVGGLSMRDYFAAKAVQGILCDGAAWVGESAITQAASVSYKLADAMLEARK